MSKPSLAGREHQQSSPFGLEHKQAPKKYGANAPYLRHIQKKYGANAPYLRHIFPA